MPLTAVQQVKYLAQLHNIAPDYAQGVYTLLQEPGFDHSEVEHRAETAHEWYKEKMFRPDAEGKPSGYPPSGPVYH